MDIYQIILVAISGAVGAWAQLKLKSTFSKYAKIASSNGITGSQTGYREEVKKPRNSATCFYNKCFTLF